MKKIFVFFFKLILFLIIAFVCFAILQIAIEEYQDYKWKKPTSEERKIIKENQLKTQERNERLYSCLVDNKETSLKLKNTECEAYADGAKVDFNDNSGKKDIIKNLKSKDHDKRYMKCYGEMTNAHKARGLHQSNRELSIRIKEGICDAYAKGEELNYEGKR